MTWTPEALTFIISYDLYHCPWLLITIDRLTLHVKGNGKIARGFIFLFDYFGLAVSFGSNQFGTKITTLRKSNLKTNLNFVFTRFSWSVLLNMGLEPLSHVRIEILWWLLYETGYESRGLVILKSTHGRKQSDFFFQSWNLLSCKFYIRG